MSHDLCQFVSFLLAYSNSSGVGDCAVMPGEKHQKVQVHSCAQISMAHIEYSQSKQAVKSRPAFCLQCCHELLTQARGTSPAKGLNEFVFLTAPPLQTAFRNLLWADQGLGFMRRHEGNAKLAMLIV